MLIDIARSFLVVDQAVPIADPPSGRRTADKEVPDLADAGTSWPLSSLSGWGDRLLLARLRAASALWTWASCKHVALER
jgi:hypothetical protein